MFTRFDAPVLERPDRGNLEGYAHVYTFNREGKLKDRVLAFVPVAEAHEWATDFNSMNIGTLVCAKVMELEGTWTAKSATDLDSEGGEV